MTRPPSPRTDAAEQEARGVERHVDALVIGGGPAGLAAAEALSAAGLGTLIAEAKPSLGRKLLMAGKSGLNLTMDADPATFPAAFPEIALQLAAALDGFGPAEAMAWAKGLGVELFTGSTGRVFPREMKASPLLRAWLARLDAAGCETRARWRWRGWDGRQALFDTPDGAARVRAGVTVLALGGASWPRLGSDGEWAPALAAAGAPLAPFRPANMGFDVAWSEHFRTRFAGAPVKAVALRFGDASVRGEFMTTAAGVEGGAVYALSAAIRDGPGTGGVLHLDLAPDRSEAALARALARPRGKASLSNHLRKSIGFRGVKAALLRECAPERLDDPAALAGAIKRLPLSLLGPRPVAEAISTAGGLRFEGLDAGLMLRARPGVFTAGEMLDWEAPTGGYLLTACLATGFLAGRSAAAYARA